MIGVLLALLQGAPAVSAGEAPPEVVTAFLAEHCTVCHGAGRQRAGVRFDDFDGQGAGPSELWALAVQRVAAGEMPPENVGERPEPAEVARFLDASRAALEATAALAAPPLRRLTAAELLFAASDLTGIRGLALPASLPPETPVGFETLAADLNTAPAHLLSWLEFAMDVADLMVPRDLPAVVFASSAADWDPGRMAWRVPGDPPAFALTGVNAAAWSGAVTADGFRAPRPGVYRVGLRVGADARAGLDGGPLRLALHAIAPDDHEYPERVPRASLPRVGELAVPLSASALLELRVELERGETVQVYLENRLAQREAAEGWSRGELAELTALARASPRPTVRLLALELEGPLAPLERQRAFAVQAGPEPLAEPAPLERGLLEFAERAFRRPLSAEERRDLQDTALRASADGSDPAAGLHQGLVRVLCAPPFLHRNAMPPEAAAFQRADRLAAFLWSSVPDAELLEAARDSSLADPAVRALQVERLLGDRRSRRFVRAFTDAWLGNRRLANLAICGRRHAWSELLREGYLDSTRRFFAEVLDSGLPIATFVDSDFTFATPAMLADWGLPTETRTLAELEDHRLQSQVAPAPRRIDLETLPPGTPPDVAGRRGVLGLPGVLAATGDGVESSIVLRGVWVLEHLFGQPPPPPPPDVPALPADVTGARSPRELLALHQASESCASCHARIDPLGLALEHFDAAGRWRERYTPDPAVRADPTAQATDVDPRAIESRAIDSSGRLPDGTPILGPDDVRGHLLRHPELFTACLTEHLLEFATGRELQPSDARFVDAIVAAEPAAGYRLPELIQAVVASPLFWGEEGP